MRPVLFAAKLRTGLTPDAGFTADSVVNYRCHATPFFCAVHGQPEITMTGTALRWQFKDGEAVWPWRSINSFDVVRSPRGAGRNGWWLN